MSLLQAYRLLIADVYELAGASRSTSEEVARSFGHTAARWHVMSVISEEAMTVPAIANRLGLTRQSVQRVVNDLVDAGLVVRVRNPGHARSPLIRLEPGGQASLRSMFDASASSREAALRRARLTERDLLATREVIGRLVDALAHERGDA